MTERLVHPLAVAEFLGFLARFAAQSRAKAVRFEQTFERAVDTILAMPEAFSWVDDEYRLYRLKKFPYIICITASTATSW